MFKLNIRIRKDEQTKMKTVAYDSIEKTEKLFQILKQFCIELKTIEGILPHLYYDYVEKTIEQAKALFKFSPFKIGDKVELNQDIKISEKESPGWLGAKHFMICGSVAKVVDIDYKNNTFIYGLRFDNDSRIDYTTKEIIKIPDDIKGVYWLSIGYLKKYNPWEHKENTNEQT